MNTYLFYDIETTGLNRAFDQVLSFSSIRTDLSFNELERHTIDIRLRPDVIPSPGAMIVNRMDVPTLLTGHTELSAITEIHRLFNRPGTNSLGYNTLGFDDEFLRFSFYRNLLSPYTHQFQHDCSRMDVFPITILYYLFKPDGLHWPHKNGKPSMKLENLNQANHLADGPAHDAMVDTAVTLALAQRLSRQEKMWQYVTGYFDKMTDGERIDALPVSFQSPAGPHRLGLMVDSGFGTDSSFLAPVLSIGQSIPYGNQTLWLRLDLPELRNTTPDNFDETARVIRKKLGEPGIVLPPLDRYWKRIDTERQSVFEENKKWLQANESLLMEIIRYHREYRYPDVPDVDPDAALYEVGFMSKRDEEICRQFHAADIKEKSRLIERLTSPVHQELAYRLMVRNFPDEVSGKIARRFNRFLKRVHPSHSEDAPVDYRGQRRTTPTAALKEIESLREEAKTGSIQLDATQKKLLADLERYLKERFFD
jgi:exodeoxyribonuclease-1